VKYSDNTKNSGETYLSWLSRGFIPVFSEIQTRTSPMITTDELQMSVRKWSASASSAWLLYFLATRYNALDRMKSTTIDIIITRKVHTLASTVTFVKNSLFTAS